MQAPPTPGRRTLIVRDNKYAVSASGMRNTGSICWFISILQALLSLTAFNRWILEHEQFITANKIERKETGLVKTLANLIRAMQSEGPSSATAREGPASIIEQMKKMDEINTNDFNLKSLQQQCAHEGCTKFIEIFGLTHLEDIFRQSFCSRTYCPVCRDFVVQKDFKTLYASMYMPIRPPTNNEETKLATTAFLKQLGARVCPVDEYNCEICGVFSKDNTAKQSDTLVLAREIITVAFIRQYIVKSHNWFPQTLYIPHGRNVKIVDKDGNERLEMKKYGTYVYKVVAQVEHSGGAESGHYWAICKRADGKVYRLNDSSATPTNTFTPSPNTVMIFYELSEYIPEKN